MRNSTKPVHVNTEMAYLCVKWVITLN